MKKDHKEKEKKIPDKGAVSAHEDEQSGEEAADHGKSKNTKTWSQTLPKHNKQETAGRKPGKSTSSTEVHGKADNAAETNENNGSDILESSEQGQWPDHLTFFGYHVLIGVVVVMLYHVLYVRSLSTISNETVKSIVIGHLKEHYGHIFKQMMEEEENEFRSTNLIPLELKIETVQADTQRALDMHVTQMKISIEELNQSQKQLEKRNAKILRLTDENSNKLEQLKNDQHSRDVENFHVVKATQKVFGTLGETEEKLTKLLFQQEDIHKRIDGIVADLEIAENNIKTVQGDLEEHYVPIFNQMMKEEENKFRSSYLKPLETEISSYLKPLESEITKINKKVEKLDTDTQKVEGLIKKANENLENLTSQQQNIQIGIDDFRIDLEVVEHIFKTVTGAQDAQVRQMKVTFEELKNSQKLLVERNSEIEGLSEAIASKLQEVTKDQQNINDKHHLQNKEFTSLIQHIANMKNNLNKELETAVTMFRSLTRSMSAVDSRLDHTRNLIVAVHSLQSKYEEKIEPYLFNKGVFPLVAFSVFNPTKLSFAEGELILFQKVQMNEGVGYNAPSGIFTSPVDGLYHFVAHFCNSGGRYFAYEIVHIDTEAARSTSFAQMSGCGSLNAIVKVKKGDQVKLKATAPTNVLEENRWRQSYFIGVLIHN